MEEPITEQNFSSFCSACAYPKDFHYARHRFTPLDSFDEYSTMISTGFIRQNLPSHYKKQYSEYLEKKLNK